MSQLKYKFIEALPSVPTPVYGILAAADRAFQEILGKLQGLLYDRAMSTSRTSIFTSTGNVTTDQDYLTLTIPANWLVSGDTFQFNMFGVHSNNDPPNNPILNMYVKVNGTKIAISGVSVGNLSNTDRPIRMRGQLTFYASGSSGTVIGGIESSITTITPTSTTGTATTAVNTTTTVTITIGGSWSAANAANTFKAMSASIFKAV